MKTLNILLLYYSINILFFLTIVSKSLALPNYNIPKNATLPLKLVERKHPKS
jgi:hypothetical protein